MTDTTAPRTVAAELHDAIDALETVSVEWAPAHSAPYISKYVLLPIVDIYAQRIEAEAIEPLLALVRALTSISPFDYEQGLCYWCGGGWEDVTGPRGGKRPPTHTGLHKDDCPFLRAALLAHAPESVRVAARKP